jgi:hypothetical protein
MHKMIADKQARVANFKRLILLNFILFYEYNNLQGGSFLPGLCCAFLEENCKIHTLSTGLSSLESFRI